ncbi:hypothetical protein ACWCPQ_14450 [Nocardia sp. NPDC001965]
MTEFRRWLAGVFGALADRLYPPYPLRVRTGNIVIRVDGPPDLAKVRQVNKLLELR